MKRYIYIEIDTSNCTEIHQYEYFEKMTKYCVGDIRKSLKRDIVEPFFLEDVHLNFVCEISKCRIWYNSISWNVK